MIARKLFDENIHLVSHQLILRPSSLEDADAFNQISSKAIWQHMSYDIAHLEDWTQYLKKSVKDRTEKVQQELTIIRMPEHEIIGATTIGNLSETDLKVEVGRSWICEKYQGKGLNTLTKLLLLEFLFEEVTLNRVEFRTRGNNVPSQRALEKIGARKEGVLRQAIFRNNEFSDVIYYSILKEEWSRVKDHLKRLAGDGH